MQTRFTPILQFVLDHGVKHSIEMTRLINEALAQSNPSGAPGGAAAEAEAGAEDDADGTAPEAPGPS